METAFILFCAGLIAGSMNALAGGGGTITYTAMIMVGLPPIVANATNTFASTAGYLTGVLGYREHIRLYAGDLSWQIPLCILGGLVGGGLLLYLGERKFMQAVPWLLLGATLIMFFSPYLLKLKRDIDKRNPIITGVLLFPVFIYNGYFNVGGGMLMLAILVLSAYHNFNAMNGLKLIFAAFSSLAAILLFGLNGKIAWADGFFMMIGIMLGSYGAARFASKLSPTLLRYVITLICLSVTLYFFYVT